LAADADPSPNDEGENEEDDDEGENAEEDDEGENAENDDEGKNAEDDEVLTQRINLEQTIRECTENSENVAPFDQQFSTAAARKSKRSRPSITLTTNDTKFK